jgi:hypothetical protein
VEIERVKMSPLREEALSFMVTMPRRREVLLPFFTSRYYEQRPEEPQNQNNWFFMFNWANLDGNEFFILAGQLGNGFRVFRIPTAYIRQHLEELRVGNDGAMHLEIRLADNVDLRSDVPFGAFILN